MPTRSATPRRKRIPVLEVFGPTVQGEGMVIGVKTMFVRTAGCDYSCSWCDSAFTWDGSAKDDIRWLEPQEIIDELTALSGGSWPGHVTLSGGNPALLPQLGELISQLQAGGSAVALETQGSRWQDWFLDIDELTLSPKPPSSGMETDWAQLESIVERLVQAGRIPSLKVVVMESKVGAEAAAEHANQPADGDSQATKKPEPAEAGSGWSDLEFAKEVHRRFPAIPMFLQAGNDQLDEPDSAALREHLAARYERLIDEVMSDPEWRRVRILPQLHAWLWGNKRGV
ncbi:7-carboxy-7-deazaguanine synthase QueE [Paenibacillus herberti]|uniref:7-carboxy-7-deazaguanine synthase n=1 Tax=Paenibacillus herberti TaxID=1619309 RepID=A0A229NYZ7_9BACL|nr:7-carboxy-7-deazaguanine synthase QueE [Paenibacillus herberti]OXM15163.1 7-carboxy-7-deazaguanine synthase QueE [Paenibacillus herberti]